MVQMEKFTVDGIQTTTGSEHMEMQESVGFGCMKEHKKYLCDAGRMRTDRVEITKVATLSNSDIRYTECAAAVVVDDLM